MDIHRPKPIQGWRDFIKEIGIIVIGVSIALAGEQGVEKWRERRDYREAREAMVNELSANLSNIRLRAKNAACSLQRMKDIGAILDRAEVGQHFDVPSWIGPPEGYRLRFAAEAEAGKSSLFSSAEQRSFGSPYSYFHSLEGEQARERLTWSRLQMLEGRSRLSPEMIQSLRESLADARNAHHRIAFLTVWAEAWGRRIGLKEFPGAASIYAPSSHPHCLPMNTPTAQAERETDLKPNF